jgi:2-dehydro-3-deoxy-D-arabinonate dehydratase
MNNSVRLYRTANGAITEVDGTRHTLPAFDWDTLFTTDDAPDFVSTLLAKATSVDAANIGNLAAPIQSQEVWAAGVTYYRSRTARMEESQDAGSGSFYDRVYSAERPELFFKATPHRVVGPGGEVRVRRDSQWNVPEPELALVINSRGEIIGYTIGNDMSSRDIEGANPLYLPQAKVYNQCCALGPAILLSTEPLPAMTEIALEIRRKDEVAFSGSTTLAQMKRTPRELVEFLFRDNSFPKGCFLLTGTGIVPPDSFTLQAGDEISITIEPIGTLTNTVVGGNAS